MCVSLPNTVSVKAPATTANLGPGYDVFGLALGQPSDKVTLTPIEKNIEIQVSGIAAGTIPTEPEENTAGIVAKHIIQKFSLNTGLRINLEKGIIPNRGLGSSAASAAAVAFGLNHLFDLNLDNNQLIQLSAKGEVASAGFEHADNVSAAVYGDFIIVKSYHPLDVVHIESPPHLGICIAIPHIPTTPKKTRKARSVVPRTISIEKVVYNLGHVATMAAGFATGKVNMIGKAMSDAIVEPARAFMVPGFYKIKERTLKAGACGVAISGAGPAIIAIVDTKNSETTKITHAMKAGFKSVGVEASTFVTKPGKGVSLLEVKK